MSNIDKEAASLLEDARSLLIVHFRFFGYLALKLNLIQSESAGGQRTAGVDGLGNLYYNPDFIKTIGLENTMVVLCHELLHIVQACHSRFPGGGVPDLWNIAADCAVNHMICDSNLPKVPLMNEIFPQQVRDKTRGKATEEIYLDLLDECKKNGGKSGGGGKSYSPPGENDPSPDSHGTGEHPDNHLGCASGTLVEGTKTQKSTRKWQQNVVAAAQMTEQTMGRGSVPGFVQEFLSKLSKPTVRWTDHLRATSTLVFKGRYTYSRPARRSEAIGARLPAKKPTPKGACVILDTSGSMSLKTLKQCLTESVEIMRSCGAPWLKIYLHDVLCYSQERYSRSSITKMKIKRGGTSHVDVFEKVAENRDDVGMIVAFTDLDTEFPSEAPRCPVIWCHPPGHKKNVPFGRTLEFKISDVD